MKVLVKVPLSPFGGYGRDGIEMITAMINRGWDVYINPTMVQAPLPEHIAALFTKTLQAPFDLYIQHVDPMQLECSDEAARSSDVAIGWTMWEYCLDTETEIFTQRGWLKWDEVRVGDSSLAVDPDNGESSWQEITDIYVGPDTERTLYKVPLGRTHVLTTADHKWLSRNAKEKNKLRWYTTETLPDSARTLRSAKRADLPAVSVMDDALVELVAWTYTEGWLERGLSVRIGQSEEVNPSKVNRIRAALQDLFGASVSRNSPHGGVTWSESSKADGMVIFNLSRQASARILMCAPDKVPSPDFLRSLTKEQLDLFIEVSVLADGYTTQHGTKAFTQMPGARMDAFCYAVALAGLTVSRPSLGTKGQQTVEVTKAEKCFRIGRGVETVQHKGRVWCPTLKHHNWLARRNGQVFFTGNTGMKGVMPEKKRKTLKKRLKKFDALVGYSDIDVEAFKPYFPEEKIIVQQGGFDAASWPVAMGRDWNDEKIRFIQHGVLSQRKDPFRLIRAFAELSRENEDFAQGATLALHTTAPGLHSKMEEVYTNLRVFYEVWPTEMVYAFYESAHVLVAPSRGEGKNLPALEFMSTGGTVIATDFSGHQQWLDPSYSYPLNCTIEPAVTDADTDAMNARADVEHLKELLLHCFENRDEVRKKGELASRIVPANHSWDRVLDKLMMKLPESLPGHKGERLKALDVIAHSSAPRKPVGT